jgi:iron complex outermembrane receptor protein
MKSGLSAALGASVSLLGLTLFAVPAAAQQAPAAAAKSDGLQEIVVTANRVESSAQKTSIALTVYSAADLADKGVTNLMALAAVDPSVNITTSSGAAYVAVRGIASTDVTEIGDPAVPIARDGFYTSRSYSIQSSMYDLSRVEVLKGPQGTLNGRNSTGGLVSIITAKPEFKDGGYASVGVGNYGAFHGEMGVNLALTDNLAIRASTVYDYHDGYRNVTGIYNGQPERGDDSDVISGRVQIAWNPLADLHLWASYQHDSIVGVGDVSMNTTLGVLPDFGNAKSFANAAPTSVNLTGDRVRWELRYDALPGGLKFVYAGGYDVEDWKHALDGTGPAFPVGYPAIRQYIQHEHPKTWNHEVRVSNDAHSRLFVQAGWFHFQENNSIESGLYNVAMTGPFAPGGPLSFMPSQAGLYGIYFSYPYVLAKSDAGFGQASFALTDTIKLSAGARYTWDKKIRTGTAALDIQALVSPFAPPINLVTLGNGNTSEGEPTFHVGLDYTPNNATLFYAKVDTGYKAGGFNSNGSAPPLPYGPEKVTTAEIGTKNRFMGNRLQLNLDAFYSNYRGYQASQTSGVLNGNGVFNVGSAKIYGAEAQGVALFGQGGRFDVNATVLHTAFGNGISVANGATPTVTVDIGGFRLPNAPSFAFTTGLEQAVPFAGGKVTGRVEGKYSSSFYYSVFNTPDTQSHAYMTGNATLTYKPDRGGWELEAYVRNFTDKVVLANAAQNFVSDLNTYEFQPPRTFGVRGSVKF